MALDTQDPAVSRNGTAALAPDPDWFRALQADYRAGVAKTFLLWGSTQDYVDDPTRDLTLAEYLALRLSKTMSVVCYSPDRGITFPGEDSPLPLLSEPARAARARFERVTDLAAGALSEAERLMASAAGTAALPNEPTEALPRLVDFLARAEGGTLRKKGETLPAGTLTTSGPLEADLTLTEDLVIGGDESGLRAVVLVERLDLIVPPADKAQIPAPERALLALLGRVGTLREIDARGNLLLLCAPSLEEIHPDLRAASSGIRAIEIRPPDYAQRLDYVRRVLAQRGLSLADLTVTELAAQTAGLGRRHIEDIALRARVAGGAVTRALVKARKAEGIASEYAEVLSILEPDVTMAQVGGHEQVKAYLEENVIGPATSEDDELRALLPKGIVFMGPGGTGKTYLARALANAVGWNCVSLEGDKLKGGIVGESERRRAKAMRGIRAMAPCLVFCDEFDQMMPRRVIGGSGDGGAAVEANAFGSMLQFFGDPALRGQVLLVAATNRPDQIDPVMFRPGRIDVKVPLLPPASAEERAGVLAALLAQARQVAAPALLARLGEETDGWTPAELERLVVMARAQAKIKGLALADALTAVRARLKPPTVAEATYQTGLALAACDDLDLVPGRYRSQVGEPVPPQAAQTGPVGVPATPRGETAREL